jgi:aspartate carbamoyltransferase regulatory subunit
MTKPTYEQIWSIQEAINMAVAEKRVVRFLSDKANVELKKGITDIKGCKLRKPSKESNDIAVIPPTVDAEEFDFNEVNMKSELWLPRSFYEEE